jgi:RNA polymerase sigma-70 factor, ECF subfamily
MTASEDFTSVTDSFRAELLAHCYRMVGSANEAQDLVPDTDLRAWRSYPGSQAVLTSADRAGHRGAC